MNFMKGFKRYVAMLLAVVMILSCGNLGAALRTYATSTGSENGESVTLGQLLVQNVGGLSDAEEAIIQSGLLKADKTYTYTKPGAEESGLIRVDEAEKKVYAVPYTKGGYTWIPVSFILKDENGTLEDNRIFTAQDDEYVGTYAYSGNSFDVVATYTLDITLSAEEVAAAGTLLSAPNKLYSDIEVLKHIDAVGVGAQMDAATKAQINAIISSYGFNVDNISADTILDVLIFNLPQLDNKCALELVYALSLTGISLPVYTIDSNYNVVAATPITESMSLAEKNAAASLNSQKNGGLDFAKFWDNTAGASYLEKLLANGSDFKTTLNKNFTELTAVNTAMKRFVSSIDLYISMNVPEMQNAVYTAINAKLAEEGRAERVNSRTELQALIAALETELDTAKNSLEEAKALYAAGLVELNEKIDTMNAQLGQNILSHVTCAADIEGLIDTLDAQRGALLATANAAAGAYGQSITSEEDVENAISTLTPMAGLSPQIAGVLAQLQQLKSALEQINTAKALLLNVQETMITAETQIADGTNAYNKGCAALELLKTADTKLGELETGVAQLESEKNKLKILVAMLDAFTATTAPVQTAFTNDTWNAPALVKDNLTAEQYADLNTNALLCATDWNGTVPATLHIANTTVMYELNRHNVHVTYKAFITDPSKDNSEDTKELPAYTENTTVILRDGATREEILAAVETAGFQALALNSWQGAIDTENFEITVSEIPDTLTANIQYTVTFTPKRYAVNYDNTFDSAHTDNLPYGYRLVLPKHSDAQLEYVYYINGETVMEQGSVLTITKDTSLSRTEGVASERKDLLDLVLNTTDGLEVNIQNILKNGALRPIHPFQLRVPYSELVSVSYQENTQSTLITAPNFGSRVGNLEWIANMVILDGVSHDMTDGTYTATDDFDFQEAKIRYQLAVTAAALGIEPQALLDAMNVPYKLSSEYKSQQTRLNSLVACMEYMKELNSEKIVANNNTLKDILGMIDSLGAELGFAPETIVAAKALDSLIPANGDYIPLYYTINDYAIAAGYDAQTKQYATPAGGMLDFYTREETYVSQIAAMNNIMVALIADPAFIAQVPAGYANTFNAMAAIFGEAAKLETEGVDHDLIDVTNILDLVSLLSTLQTVSTGNLATNYTTAPSSFLWTTELTASGIATSTITMTVKLGNNTYVDSDTIATGKSITREQLLAWARSLASQVGMTDELANYYHEVENLADTVISSNTAFQMSWEPNIYNVVVGGEIVDTMSYIDTEITLPAHTTEGMRYDYYIGTTPLANGTVHLTMDQFKAIVAGTVEITRNEVDIEAEANARREAALIRMVNNANGKLVLTKDANGKYALVLRIDHTHPRHDMVEFGVALIQANYAYFTINGETFYDGNQYHMQTLVDAFLNSGISIESFASKINEDGTTEQLVLPGDVITNYTHNEMGMEVLKTVVELGSSADDKTDLDFYITMTTDAELMKNFKTAAEKAGDYVQVEMNNGVVDAVVTLPDAAYGAAIAAMTLTGEADIHDFNAMNHQIALGYILDMVDPLLNKNSADWGAIENSFAMLGATKVLNKADDLCNKLTALGLSNEQASLEYIYNAFTSRYDKNIVEYPTDGGALLDLEQIPIDKVIDELQVSVDEKLDELYGDAIDGIDIQLSQLIYEYDSGIHATVEAELTNINRDYDALFVDAKAEGITNKAGLATAADIASKASSANIIVLLDDVTADLNFTGNAVLDLNGKTVNGNISSTGRLFIVDNVYNLNADGTVTGTVTGATVVGGKYLTDVTSCLKGGFVQGDDGIVYNKFFTFVGDNNNNLTLTLNATPDDIIEFANKQSLVSIAAEAVMYIAMNHYNSACLYLNNGKVFDFRVDDIVGMFAEGNKLYAAIDAVLNWFSAADVSAIANDLIAEFTDFATLSQRLSSSNDGMIASYEIKTAPWSIEISKENGAQGDYFTVSGGSAAEKETYNLNIYVTGSLRNELSKILAGLADTTTVNAQVSVGDIVRNERTFLVSGDVSGSVDVDLTHDAGYAVLASVILANGSTGAMRQNLLNGIANYYNYADFSVLESVYDNLAVAQVIKAVRDINTAADFTAMLNGLELDSSIKSKILRDVNNDMKGFAIALKAASATLRRLDVVGTSNTLGSLKKVDGNGNPYYALTVDKSFVKNKELKRGFTVDCDVSIGEISASLRIFNKTPITVTCDGTTTVFSDLNEALNHSGTHSNVCQISVNVRSAMDANVTLNHDMSIVKAENINANGKTITLADGVSLTVDAELPAGTVIATDESRYIAFANGVYTVEFYNYQIGDTYVKTLQEALSVANDGDTISVLRPVEEEGAFASDNSITVAGADKISFTDATYTLGADATITFQGTTNAPTGLTVTSAVENAKLTSGASDGNYIYSSTVYDIVVTDPAENKNYFNDSLDDVLSGSLVNGSTIRIYNDVTFNADAELNITGTAQSGNTLAIYGVELVTGDGQIIANTATTAAWTIATYKTDGTAVDTDFAGDSDSYAGTSVNGVISWAQYSVIITSGTDTFRYSVQELDEAIDKIATLTGAVTVTLNEAVTLNKDITLNNAQVSIVNPANLTINGMKIQLNNTSDTVTFVGGLPADIPTNPMQALAMLRNTVKVNVTHYEAAVAPVSGNYVLSVKLSAHQMTHNAEVPATYEAAGTKEHWVCGIDSKKYWDEAGTREITNPDDLIIPKLIAAIEVSDGTQTWYYAAEDVSTAISKVNSLTGAISITLNENVSLSADITLNNTQVTINNTSKLSLNSKKIQFNNAADSVTFAGGLPADLPTDPMQALVVLRGSAVVNVTHYEINVAPVSGNYVLSLKLSDHVMTRHQEVPATYTQTGTKEHWTCGIDGKKYWDEAGTREITNPDDLIIPVVVADIEIVSGNDTFYYDADDISDAIAKLNALTGAVTVRLNGAVSLSDNIVLNNTQVTITNTANLSINGKKIQFNNVADTVLFTGGLPADLPTNPAQALLALRTSADVQVTHYEINASPATDGYLLKLTYADHEMTYQQEVPATYTQTGTKAHWVCGIDGKKYWDEAGTQEITNPDDLIIPVAIADIVVSDGTNTWYYAAMDVSDAIANVNSLTGAVTITLNNPVSLSDNIVLNGTQVTVNNTAKLTLNGKKIHFNNAADSVTFAGGLPTEIAVAPTQALILLKSAVIVNITHYQVKVANAGLSYVLSVEQAPHQMTHHPEEPASYTSSGTKEYWQCGIDNKKYYDAAGTQEVADDADLIIPQLVAVVEVSKGTDTWYYGATEVNDAIAKVNGLTGAVTVKINENITLTGNIVLNGTQVTMVNTSKLTLNGKKIHFNNVADTVLFTGGLPADLPTNPMQALVVLRGSAVVNVTHYEVAVAPVSGNYLLSIVPAQHQMVHHAEEPASYTAPGTKEYWQCGIDGKKYWDEAGTREITDESELVIPQLTAAIEISSGNDKWYYGAENVSDAIDKLNSLTGAVTIKLNENVALSKDISLNGTQVTIQYTAKMSLNGKKIQLNNASDTVTFTGGLPADLPTDLNQALVYLQNSVVVNVSGYEIAGAQVPGGYMMSLAPVQTQMIHHPEEPASYTAPGTKEYWENSVTGKKYWDEAGTREITDESELVIPQLIAAIEITGGNGKWYYGAENVSDAIDKLNSLTGAVTIKLNENVALSKDISLNGTQVTIQNTSKLSLNGKKMQLNNAADKITFIGGLPADLPTNPSQALIVLQSSVVVNVPNYQVVGAQVSGGYMLSIIPAQAQMIHRPEEPASYTAPGTKEHWVSVINGKKYWDEAGTREITDESELVIPQLIAAIEITDGNGTLYYGAENVSDAIDKLNSLTGAVTVKLNENVALTKDISLNGTQVTIQNTSKMSLNGKKIKLNNPADKVVFTGGLPAGLPTNPSQALVVLQNSVVVNVPNYQIAVQQQGTNVVLSLAPGSVTLPSIVATGNIKGAKQFLDPTTKTLYLIVDLHPTDGMSLNELKRSLTFIEFAGYNVDMQIQGNSGYGIVKTEDTLVVTAKNTAGAVVSKITYKVVVLGDTSCDGKVLSNDATIIMKIFYGSVRASKAVLIAADSNTDGNYLLPVIGSADARRNMYKYFNWGSGYTSTLR